MRRGRVYKKDKQKHSTSIYFTITLKVLPCMHAIKYFVLQLVFEGDFHLSLALFHHHLVPLGPGV